MGLWNGRYLSGKPIMDGALSGQATRQSLQRMQTYPGILRIFGPEKGDSVMVDQWAGSSDIFTDYEGTIVEASFITGEYGTQMKLTFDEIDGREDPVFEYYGIPDSYESNDGGDTVERVDGKDKAMSKSCKWMRFVRAAGALKGVRDAFTVNAPLDAREWVGSRWRMEAEEGKAYKVKDKVTGEEKTGVSKDINFPTAFLGKDSSVSTSSSESSTNGTGNGKVDQLSVLNDLNNPELATSILNTAKTLPYNEWFANSYAAIQTAQVDPKSIPDLLNAMAGRGLYEGLGGKG